MDGRRRNEYMGRNRYSRAEGYESFDCDPDCPDSWMTSYPSSNINEASRIRSDRNCPYDRANLPRHGYFESQRGYKGHRKQRSARRGWGGNARGTFRNDFGPPEAVRGTGRHLPPHIRDSAPDVIGLKGLRGFHDNTFFGGGFRKNYKNYKTGKNKFTGDKGTPPVKTLQKNSEDNEAKADESDSDEEGSAAVAGGSTKSTGKNKLTGDKGTPPVMTSQTNSEDNGAKAEEAESDSDGDGNAAEVVGNTEAERDDKEEGEETGKDKQEGKNMLNKKQEARRFRDRIVESIQFVCSLCKFRTFCDETMTRHLQSFFHKEHIRYVGRNLPSPSGDFLQEYIVHKSKKVRKRRGAIRDLGTIIQQIHQDRDITQDIVMEHFVKKVEVTHCAACNLFFPMDYISLKRHLKSQPHKRMRKIMMENSKKKALTVANIILNTASIGKKLESYIKGQNPFTAEYTEESTEMAIEGEKQDFSSNELPTAMSVDETWKVTTCEESSEEEDVLQSEENLEGVPDGELVNMKDPVL